MVLRNQAGRRGRCAFFKIGNGYFIVHTANYSTTENEVVVQSNFNRILISLEN